MFKSSDFVIITMNVSSRRVNFSENTQARLSLDLLIGLSIFMFTFIFIAQFLPGVFADVRSEIALSHQAYRVATLLAEDPGALLNVVSGETTGDWQLKNASELCLNNSILFRPGLATWDGTEVLYNHLDLEKVRKLNQTLRFSHECLEKVKDMLGLNLTDIGYKITYNLNVTLKTLDGSLCRINGIYLNAGDTVPKENVQLIKYERLVYFDAPGNVCPPGTGYGHGARTPIAGRCVCILEVRIWR